VDLPFFLEFVLTSFLDAIRLLMDFTFSTSPMIEDADICADSAAISRRVFGLGGVYVVEPTWTMDGFC
jgi:hypothetical protein